MLYTAQAVGVDKTFSLTALDYPPYISKELIKQKKSWVLDVVKAALEPQGYKIKVTIKPWARAYLDAQEGRDDGLYGAGWTQERLQWFEFSLPIGKISKGFFKRKDRKDIIFTGDFQSIKNHKIAVGREFITDPEFDKAEYLTKFPVKNSAQGLKMLFLKRVDLVVASKEVDDFRFDILEKEFPGIRDSVIFMQPSLKSIPLYIAVSKKAANYQEKLKDLNLGMSRIMLDGTYTKILKKHGVK